MQATAENGDSVSYDGMFVQGRMAGKGVLAVGETGLDGEFKDNIFCRGLVTLKGGRKFEYDLEKSAVFEIMPNGERRPIDRTDLPNLGI